MTLWKRLLVMAVAIALPSPILAASPPSVARAPQPSIERLPPIRGLGQRAPHARKQARQPAPGVVPAARPDNRHPNFRPESVNGIKWFQNGRSYFSS